jgi:hypothetical protein
MISYMEGSDAERYPFNIVAVYDIGYSWEEAEIIVRAYAKEHNIEGEALDRMLDKKRQMIFSTPCNIHFEEKY